MTPEEKAVLEAALEWSHYGMRHAELDAVVEAYRQSLKPRPRWTVATEMREVNTAIWHQITPVLCYCGKATSITGTKFELENIAALLNEEESLRKP